MIALFIFRSNVRGMQYGIGTYIRELSEALLIYTDIKIYIITYHNSRVNEFKFESLSGRYYEINIPPPKLTHLQNYQNETRYAKAVVNLLSELISKNKLIIFQMNYTYDLALIKVLKERYIHPVISVVHFFKWEQLLNGNKQKLSSLNIDVPTNYKELAIFTEKEMYQFSDHVVTINPTMKDFIIEKYGLPPEKISLIRNGLDYTKFSKISKNKKINLRQKLGFYSHEKIILFAGRVDPDKGIYFLIEAFIEACKVRNDLRLVFIGQGNIQEILEKCKFNIGKITFTGFLQHDKIKEFYQIANIGVVPSIYEPCSYSRLEMIASGIPLILSKIEGFNDMSEGDQCIFITRHAKPDGEIFFDTKEFCDAILTLASNDKLADKLAANAYKTILVKNSASFMVAEMNTLFKTLIKSKKLNLEYETSWRR